MTPVTGGRARYVINSASLGEIPHPQTRRAPRSKRFVSLGPRSIARPPLALIRRTYFTTSPKRAGGFFNQSERE